MKEQFVTYEIALELAKLNFNEKCFGYYGVENELYIEISCNLDTNLTRRNFIAAPTFSAAFRWFREKYGLWFRPDYYDEMKEYNFQGSIHKLGKYSAITNIDNYKTPEEAELACLKKLIEIVKENENNK